MGYDQWIRIDFTKEGCDYKTIKIALYLAFPGIVEYLEECDTWEPEEEESNTLHYEKDGKHLWDNLKLFGEFSAQEISEKLGCTVEVYYEGEDKEDAESIRVVNGELKEHRVLQWVDVDI
jgi:hypothetical protein